MYKYNSWKANDQIKDFAITVKEPYQYHEWKVLSKSKVDVSVNKNAFKRTNLKITKKCEIVT
jgi:hypothetical protein